MKDFFRKLHLWVSVPFGAVIAITCFTGALLVFEDDITYLYYSDAARVTPQGEPMPLAQLMECVAERLPDLDGTKTDDWGRQKSVRVLCSCTQKSGKVFVKEGYYVFHGDDVYWRIPGSIDCVTHWMPLPEPPEVEV